MIQPLFSKQNSGQGALEYLLLIGGAVLVATIILVIAIGGIFPSTENIISDNLNNFESQITLHTALGGGGGPGGSDTTPPSLSFSVSPGDTLVSATYSGNDVATPPVTFRLAYGTDSVELTNMVSSDFVGGAYGSFTTIVSPGSSPFDVVGLTNGTAYFFRMRACDSVGTPNCTLSSVETATPSTGGGGGPSIVSFSADDPASDLYVQNLDWSTSGTVDQIGLCFVDSGSGDLTTTLSSYSDYSSFDSDCVGAGGTTIDVSGLSTSDVSGIMSNAAYDFALIACDVGGAVCSAVNFIDDHTTNSMASFFGFDWSTTGSITNGVVRFNDGSEGLRTGGWTITNTSSQTLPVDQIAVTFTPPAGGATVMNAVRLGGVQCFAGAGASSGSTVGTIGVPFPCSIPVGSSTDTRITYNASIHGDGTAQQIQFHFLDGSSTQTNYLREVFATNTLYGRCVGTGFTGPPTGTANQLVTDQGVAGGDRGIVERWTWTIPSGSTGLAYATQGHNVTAVTGTPAPHEYVITLSPGDFPGSSATCIAAGIDSVVESGVGVGTATNIYPGGTTVGFNYLDVSSFVGTSSSWDMAMVGEDVGESNTNFRTVSTDGSTPATTAGLLLGYVTSS